MTRTSIATDDFNRGSLGANWTNINTGNAGDISIDSSIRFQGQYGVQPTNQIAEAVWAGSGSFSDDQYSSVRLLNPLANGGSANRFGAAVRVSGSAGSRSCYIGWVQQDSATTPTTVLAKIVSGTITVLHSAAQTWAANDTIDLEVEGTSVRLCRNGTALGGSFTQTDSDVTTGKPGIAATISAYGDDWDGGDYSSAGPTSATLTGPTTGNTGSASTNFTVTLDAAATSTVTITPAGTNGTVTFSPTSPTITAGNTSTTFTANPASNGAHSISITTSPTLSYSGTPITYTTQTAVSFSGTVPAQSGVTGTSFSLDLSTYFAGGFSRTYAVQSGSLTSSGLSLNTSTAIVSGTLATVGAYTISVRATDSQSNTATTNSFTITISSTGTAPTVSSNPSNTTVTAGDTATMTAAASGSPTPTVQWQENTGSWTNISGQTTTTLSLGVVGTVDNGRVFRAVFTNSSGTATTTSATLTVNAAAGDGTITSEPLKNNMGQLIGANTLTWCGFRNASTGADVLLLTSVAVNSSSVFTTGTNAALAPGQLYAINWKTADGKYGYAWANAV